MGSLLNAPSFSSYEDFDPSFEWSRGDSLDILIIDLPGFKKEHLKVQVDSGGNLRTSGNRPLDGGRWIRFWKDFRVPKNCSIQAIQAKFENEKIHVLFPKSVDVEAQKAPAPVPVPVPTPAAPPKRAAAEDDKKQQQKANGKSTEPVNARQDLDKRKEEEEKLKSKKEDKSSDAEKKTAPAPDIDDFKSKKEDKSNGAEKETAPARRPRQDIDELKSKNEDKSSGAEKKTAPAPGPRQDMEDKSSGGEKKTAPTVISEPKTDGKSSDEKKMVPPPPATTWKPSDGGMEGVTEEPDKVGLAMGLTQVLNVAVATLVLLGLAFYLKYKLTKAETE